jgi:hypothetical protein
MKQEHKDAISRVRASAAYLENQSYDSGLFNAADVRVVLDKLEDKEIKLKLVEEDLRTLLEIAVEIDRMGLVAALQSTYVFLKASE